MDYDDQPPPREFIASYPFDSSDATSDIVLLSSDKIHFYCHKVILSLSSPYFKEKFTIPSGYVDAAPILFMSEDSKILDKILRFCYPAVDPKFESLSEFYQVVTTMVNKFSMRNVARRARGELCKYAKSEPLRVFAIAYAMQWNDEAAEAAACVLNRPLLALDDQDIPELDILPSPRVLYRLFKTYHTRSDAVCQAANKSDDDAIIGLLNGVACSEHDSFPDPEGTPTKTWFVRYCTSVRETLCHEPSLETLFACDEWARPLAERTASSCVHCSQLDLEGLFRNCIPYIYLGNIKKALKMRFEL